MTVPKHVLVVDDEQHWLDRACAAVTACGHIPVMAKDLHQATQQLENETFSLVITDNNMHRISDAGIELLQYMNRRLSERPPTILHTSEAPKELEMLLKVFPWMTYVHKDIPGDDSELASTIKRILT